MREESSLDNKRKENSFWECPVYIHWGLKKLQKHKQLSPFRFQFHNLRWCLKISSYIQIKIWMHYDFFSAYKGYVNSHFCLLQIWDSVLSGLHLRVKRSETGLSLPVFHSLKLSCFQSLRLHVSPLKATKLFALPCHTLKLFRKGKPGRELARRTPVWKTRRQAVRKGVQGSERLPKAEEFETVTSVLHWRLHFSEHTATTVSSLAEIIPTRGVLAGIFSQFSDFLYS